MLRLLSGIKTKQARPSAFGMITDTSKGSRICKSYFLMLHLPLGMSQLHQIHYIVSKKDVIYIVTYVQGWSIKSEGAKYYTLVAKLKRKEGYML